ncbi:MAG: hypothetical protein H6Q26_424 [Bacteroidetes bacterium]|nr:hypothetical protein [Bacteroidota bacterium]
MAVLPFWPAICYFYNDRIGKVGSDVIINISNIKDNFYCAITRYFRTKINRYSKKSLSLRVCGKPLLFYLHALYS